MSITIAERFRKAFNGRKNIMTPYVIRYGSREGRFYEFSSGEGFKRETIYAVTVLDPKGRPDHPASCCFGDDRNAAEAYIKSGFAEGLRP